MIKTLLLIICISLSATLMCAAHAVTKNISDKKVSSVTRSPADTISADNILSFAQSLIGTPYRPKSSSPLLGFDCSGFVSYVFKKFNFNVPRSSCEFISVGKKVRLEDALPGDIILFTGTQKHTHKIGHIGIVYSTLNGVFKFIHSTSGKEYGVTITDMDERYLRRFVQIIRLI